MCVVWMTTGHIGLGGLQSVNKTHSHEKVQMSIDGGWGDLSPLLLLKARDEFVG